MVECCGCADSIRKQPPCCGFAGWPIDFRRIATGRRRSWAADRRSRDRLTRVLVGPFDGPRDEMRGMISPGRQRAVGGIELKMQAFAAAACQVELVELLHVLDGAANLFGGVG